MNNAYRLCRVNGRIAAFHCWEQYSNVVNASHLVGGYPGGTISFVRGIVEYDDGTLDLVAPKTIRFVDIPEELKGYEG